MNCFFLMACILLSGITRSTLAFQKVGSLGSTLFTIMLYPLTWVQIALKVSNASIENKILVDALLATNNTPYDLTKSTICILGPRRDGGGGLKRSIVHIHAQHCLPKRTRD
jgi:hypothetical protein